MRVQEELTEEEKRSQFKVAGLLTLKEQREERGQYRLRRRARETRDGCLQDTQPGLVLSVDGYGANPLDWNVNLHLEKLTHQIQPHQL